MGRVESALEIWAQKVRGAIVRVDVRMHSVHARQALSIRKCVGRRFCQCMEG
jgi:hypothetical protein